MSTLEYYGHLFPTAVIGSMPRSDFVRELVMAQGRDESNRKGMDAAIAYIAGMQEAAGLDVISDGEWRRASYIGVIAELAHGFEVGVDPTSGRPWTVVTGEVHPKNPGFAAAEARYLKGVARAKIKVPLPSPALLGERLWDAERSRNAYPSRRDFVRACVPILRHEVELLAEEGVDVVQIDDPHLCILVDPQVRARYDSVDAEEAGGADGEAAFSVEMTNAVVEGLQSRVRLALHLCRRAGARVRGEVEFAGDFQPIIGALNELEVHQLNMEFTAPGAGDVQVLRGLREDFEIGLGCVSVHPGQIDAPEAIVARLDRAVEVMDAGRIALTPDCGFAPGSAARVDIDEVYAKLKSMVSAAEMLRQRHG